MEENINIEKVENSFKKDFLGGKSYYLLGIIALSFLTIIFLTSKLLLLGKQQKTQIVNQAKLTSMTIPPNAVRISGCIAHEGEHWVERDKIPNGPFYVVYNGKVTAIEYMFKDTEVPGEDFAHKSQQDALEYLQSNKLNLSGLVHQLDKPFEVPPNVAIKSWSIHWTPPHAGFVEPHYDVHLYLVDAAEKETICPDSTFENVLPSDLYEELKNQGIAVP